MAQVSVRLREARERAGLTLADISARTRISLAFVKAIEAGNFDRLPGDFYARAFLRTYARELRLSPDEIVHDYDVERQPAQLASEPPRRAAPQNTRPAVAWARSIPPDWPAALRRRARSVPAGAWAAAALAVVLATVFLARNPATEARSETGSVGMTGALAPDAAPTATAGRTQPVPQPRAPDSLVIDIRPSGVTWVAATADGTRTVYRLLQPGEQVTVQARNAVSFRIGDAGAFAFAVNGHPGKPLGARGEVREFQITRENFRTFLR